MVLIMMASPTTSPHNGYPKSSIGVYIYKAMPTTTASMVRIWYAAAATRLVLGFSPVARFVAVPNPVEFFLCHLPSFFLPLRIS